MWQNISGNVKDAKQHKKSYGNHGCLIVNIAVWHGTVSLIKLFVDNFQEVSNY